LVNSPYFSQMKTLLFLTTYFSVFLSVAQKVNSKDVNALGYHFDIEGNPIIGYFYNSYRPEEYFRLDINPNKNYYSGAIGLEGVSLEGYIALPLNGKHVYFKDSLKGKKEKIKKVN